LSGDPEAARRSQVTPRRRSSRTHSCTQRSWPAASSSMTRRQRQDLVVDQVADRQRRAAGGRERPRTRRDGGRETSSQESATPWAQNAHRSQVTTRASVVLDLRPMIRQPTSTPRRAAASARSSSASSATSSSGPGEAVVVVAGCLLRRAYSVSKQARSARFIGCRGRLGQTSHGAGACAQPSLGRSNGLCMCADLDADRTGHGR